MSADFDIQSSEGLGVRNSTPSNGDFRREFSGYQPAERRSVEDVEPQKPSVSVVTWGLGGLAWVFLAISWAVREQPAWMMVIAVCFLVLHAVMFLKAIKQKRRTKKRTARNR